MSESSQVRRIHIVGRKNAGKTTLVCDLVSELTRRGLKVATIKHTHHQHELDTPGKDSHRHREAGAAAVGILSPLMTAVFLPIERTEGDRYAAFDPFLECCDIVIVEGDLHAKGTRIEVWRSEVSEPPYAASDQGIVAVATDDAVNLPCPVWPRSDIAALADRLLSEN